eukprot:jgi/Orpsp1_1/1177136/evm.model.c7180000060317.1
MEFFKYSLIYLLIIFNIIYTGLSETLSSYLKQTEYFDYVGESNNCISSYESFEGCIINVNEDSLIDFNDICEVFNSNVCQNAYKNINKSFSNCLTLNQKIIKNTVNKYTSILPFFCYKDSNNEYCPINRLFQKYLTLNVEIDPDYFKTIKFLNEVCIDKSCYGYIDSSYKIIQKLYDIDIINNKDIVDTKEIIKVYLNSNNCQNTLK